MAKRSRTAARPGQRRPLQRPAARPAGASDRPLGSLTREEELRAAELGLPIQSVNVARPTLDDVFMSYTGTTIRDAEEDPDKARNRVMMQMMGGRR